MDGELKKIRTERNKLKEELADLKLFSQLYCMCGDPMEGHGFSSGHSPVEMGEYYFGRLSEKNDKLKQGMQALESAIQRGVLLSWSVDEEVFIMLHAEDEGSINKSRLLESIAEYLHTLEND